MSAHLGEMFGQIPAGLVLDGDDVPVLITVQEDRDVNVVQFACHPDSLRAMVRNGLVHLAQEPLQKGAADAMGLAGVKQPGQHVAVADLVLRVAQDVEGIELLPLRILRVVSQESRVLNQLVELLVHRLLVHCRVLWSCVLVRHPSGDPEADVSGSPTAAPSPLGARRGSPFGTGLRLMLGEVSRSLAIQIMLGPLAMG